MKKSTILSKFLTTNHIALAIKEIHPIIGTNFSTIGNNVLKNPNATTL